MGRAKTSPVWNLFQDHPDKKSFAVCKLCNEEVTRGGSDPSKWGTSNLIRHAKKLHLKEFEDAETKVQNEKEGKGKKKMMTNYFGAASNNSLNIESVPRSNNLSSMNASSNHITQQTLGETWKKSVEKKKGWDKSDSRYIAIVNFICMMISVDSQPFSIVEDYGFNKLLNYLRPEFKMPSRSYITKRKIPEMYESVRKRVHGILDNARYISFTTDLWTSSHKRDAFISFTAHCVTETYETVCVVLDAKYFPESHTADHIKENIFEMIRSFEIPKEKIHMIVTDNCRNIVNAVKDAGYDHLPCFLHSLQLIINKSILEQTGVKNIIADCKKIVGHFSHSLPASSELQELQIENRLPQHKLIQDVATRWNSTHHMSTRMVEQKPAINEYSTKHQDKVPWISPRQWTTLEDMTKILKIFDKATKR